MTETTGWMAERLRSFRAAADQLWTLVSDVTRAGEWSPENIGGSWLVGATAPVVGPA